MRKKKPGGYGYGSNSLLTSVDVRPTAIDWSTASMAYLSVSSGDHCAVWLHSTQPLCDSVTWTQNMCIVLCAISHYRHFIDTFIMITEPITTRLQFMLRNADQRIRMIL